MKKIRNLHLWIGLFASLLILLEGVTGLIMIEPWLIGINQPPTEQRVQIEEEAMGGAVNGGEPHERDFEDSDRANDLMRTIKALHAGRIGDANLSIILEIIAVSLIILTTTGIILSINKLRARR